MSQTRLIALAKVVGGIVLVLALPHLLPIIPGISANNYTYSLLNLALIYAIVAVGLTVLTGLAGQISLGHAGLLAIGAFACGGTMTRFDLPFWIALPLAGLVTGAIGFVLALPALRLSGPYLAVATLGFTIAVPQIIKLFNFKADGVPGLRIAKQTIPGYDLENDLARYYLIVPVLALVIWWALNLKRTRTGRAFVAIRDSEIAAQAMGIGLERYKVTAFTVSAFFSGLAGALYVAHVGFISVEDFSLLLSISFLAMIILGGAGSIWGAVVGAVLLAVLPEAVNRLTQALQTSLNDNGIAVQLKNPQYILFGLIIILATLFMPYGLAGAWERIVRRLRRRPDDRGKPTSAADVDTGEMLPALRSKP